MSSQETKKDSGGSLPFHKTIVNAISWASNSELECLAELIKVTKIPANHDEIIRAWKRRVPCLSGDLGVTDYLLKQKKENAENGEGVEFNDIEKEALRLLVFLQAREVGDVTWHVAVREQLMTLRDLVSRALDKK